MISRLLLVGMVGVLGISLPDGAEWGMGRTWARTGAPPSSCRRAAVAVEPIAVDDHSTDRIADAPNRRPEAPDLSVTTTPVVATTHQPVATESTEAVDKLFADNQVWGEPANAEAVDKLFADNQVWGEPADAVETVLADNQVWAEPTDEPIATSVPPAWEARPRFEPIVVDDAPSIADVLNRTSDGIDLDPSSVAVRTPDRPSFEPIAVANDSPSIADELNRASDGIAIAQKVEPQFQTAIRLTRDAVLAWMNVLTKTLPTSNTMR
jgi:hypothetical protein